MHLPSARVAAIGAAVPAFFGPAPEDPVLAERHAAAGEAGLAKHEVLMTMDVIGLCPTPSPRGSPVDLGPSCISARFAGPSARSGYALGQVQLPSAP